MAMTRSSLLALMALLLLTAPACKSSASSVKVSGLSATALDCKTNGGKGNWCHFKCKSASGWCSYDGDGAKKEKNCTVPSGVSSTSCANGGATDQQPKAAASAASPASSGSCPDCKDCGDKCCTNPGEWYACNDWWCAKDDGGTGKDCVIKKQDSGDATKSASSGAAGGACKDCKDCGDKCCHNPGPWYECNGWWCAKDEGGTGNECLVQKK